MKKHAFPLQLAKEAILLGRYPEAVSLLQPLSANGIRDAQFLYAYLHFWDDRLSRIAAVNLMTTAARWGHSEANYILAACPDLLPGYTFTPPETQTQFEYLRKAHELGSDFAAADMAECYLQGNHVEPNPEVARKLLEPNFERGKSHRLLSKTCYLLGRMELLGIGGETNIGEGIRKLHYSVINHSAPHTSDGSYASDAIEFLKSHAAHLPDVDLEALLRELVEHHANQKHVPMWERFLHHYCANSLEYDLRTVGIDAFMDFVFDHYPRLWRDREVFHWERQARVTFSPPEVVRLYTEMFQNAHLIAERYSADQIEQGIGMSGIRGWANWTIGCVLTDASTLLDDAVACIHAMYELFEQLFSKADFENIGYMWWDIGYGACSHGSREDLAVNKREWTEEVRYQLSQATFETMVRVLSHPHMRCQEAAIHGLGHSHHPEKKQVLERYLENNPNIPLRLREYTLAAMRGEIM